MLNQRFGQPTWQKSLGDLPAGHQNRVGDLRSCGCVEFGPAESPGGPGLFGRLTHSTRKRCAIQEIRQRFHQATHRLDVMPHCGGYTRVPPSHERTMWG